MRDNRYHHEPSLTDQQEKFARGLAGGLQQTEAARIAGYADPRVAAVRLARSEAVRARVRALRTNEIDKLASLSLRALRELLTRKEDLVRGIRGVSDAVRLNAVKLSLALAGHVEKPTEEANALKGKDISGMSIDELDAFIHAEKAKAADRAKPIIDHEPVQSPSNSLNNHDKSEPLEGSTLQIEGDCVTLDPPSSELEPEAGESDPPPGVPDRPIAFQGPPPRD